MIGSGFIGKPSRGHIGYSELNAGRLGAQTGFGHRANAAGVGSAGHSAGCTVRPFAGDSCIGNQLLVIIVNINGHYGIPLCARGRRRTIKIADVQGSC